MMTGLPFLSLIRQHLPLSYTLYIINNDTCICFLFQIFLSRQLISRFSVNLLGLARSQSLLVESNCPLWTTIQEAQHDMNENPVIDRSTHLLARSTLHPDRDRRKWGKNANKPPWRGSLAPLVREPPTSHPACVAGPHSLQWCCWVLVQRPDRGGRSAIPQSSCWKMSPQRAFAGGPCDFRSHPAAIPAREEIFHWFQA